MNTSNNSRSEPDTSSRSEELRQYLSKIFLLVLCAAALPALLNTHLSPKNNDDHRLNVWHQPPILDQEQFAPITLQKGLSFVELEKQLSGLSSNASGLVNINSNLLKVLETITGSLPNVLSHPEREQIKTVITRSFPGAKGHQLSELVGQHHRYANAQYEGTNTPQTDLERQALFFGEQVANQLFRQQNELRAYLTARSDIRKNASLSKTEKEEKLSELEKHFQHTRQTHFQERSK